MIAHSGKLRIWKEFDKEPIEIQNPNEKILIESLKIIPPGAIFVSMSDNLISKLIGIWIFITNLFKVIFSGFRILFSHMGIYIGNGDNQTIEAREKGVKVYNFRDYLDEKNKFRLYVFKDMTISQLQKMKEFLYQQIGKPYDFQAFAKFVLRQLEQNKDAYICSELVAEALKVAKIPFLDKDTSQIHPFDAEQWLESSEAFEIGFRKLCEWGY